MRSRYFFALLISGLFFSIKADSQTVILQRGGGYYRPRVPRRMVRPVPQNMRQRQQLPKFEPSVSLSFGYGFPNLDKNYLPEYYNAFSGKIAQTGPVTGSIDYRFNRNMSIGATVAYGKVSSPYYYYNTNNSQPDFNARLENWAFMLNLKSYLQAGPNISPYIRLSGGVNSWNQTFTDGAGNKLPMQQIDLPDFAYQVGIGADFKLSKNASLFAEAGYGKYILQGGLSFKF